MKIILKEIDNTLCCQLCGKLCDIVWYSLKWLLFNYYYYYFEKYILLYNSNISVKISWSTGISWNACEVTLRVALEIKLMSSYSKTAKNITNYLHAWVCIVDETTLFTQRHAEHVDVLFKSSQILIHIMIWSNVQPYFWFIIPNLQLLHCGNHRALW